MHRSLTNGFQEWSPALSHFTMASSHKNYTCTLKSLAYCFHFYLHAEATWALWSSSHFSFLPSFSHLSCSTWLLYVPSTCQSALLSFHPLGPPSHLIPLPTHVCSVCHDRIRYAHFPILFPHRSGCSFWSASTFFLFLSPKSEHSTAPIVLGSTCVIYAYKFGRRRTKRRARGTRGKRESMDFYGGRRQYSPDNTSTRHSVLSCISAWWSCKFYWSST